MNAVATEQDGIYQAINLYIDGLLGGSVETLKQAFHTEATMCGYFGETLMVVPIQGLYDFVASNDAPAKTGEPFEASVAAIEVAGSVASARITEKSYQGFNFTTFFQLLKIDGRWWIVGKVFNVDSQS
ncbi:MAG: nuclear transport factor 2 family protein [Pyrinomonadaceae bacterium]